MNPLQTRIDSIEERLARIEKIVLEENYLSKKRNDLENLIIDKIDKIPMQHLTIISLYLNTNQTREEISNTLEDWGKNIENRFQKIYDNLIKKKLIKKRSYKNENKYSLTAKGEIVADKIIQQLISGKKLQLEEI